jgi:hypothetical protein
MALIVCALGLANFIPRQAAAQPSVWTGSADDDWFNAANWTLGIPDTSFVSNKRANLQSATDLANWPVIKSGQTVNISQRVQMPLGPLGAEAVTYGRLTIESGGTFHANNDLRAGEDDGIGDAEGNPLQVIVGSLNVAGTMTLGNRTRFANADFTTMDVDVTGTMTHTNQGQAFRIGGGDHSSADFDISGTGLVSVTAPFELFEGSLLSLSDDGKLRLSEYEYVIEDEFGNPIGTATYTKAEIIAQVTPYATAGWFEGLTDTYSGMETLTGIGNGLAYFEEASSVTFVSAPIAPVVGGDVNGDGVYDAADYVAWRKNGGPPEQYADWVKNFGTSLIVGGGNGAEGVPELSTLGLVACGLVLLPVQRSRKGRAVAE